MESFIKAHAVTLSPADLAKLAGFYVNTDNGMRRRVSIKEGKLVVDRGRGIESELVPIAADRFVLRDIPVKAEISFEERYPQFRVMLLSSGAGTTPLALVYAGPESADSPPLSEYNGTFQSDEAGAVVSFVVRNSKLVLRTRGFDEPKTSAAEDAGRGWYPLESVCADSFKNNWLGLLRFTRDSRKQIDGFFTSNFAGGVRHLQFHKLRP